MSYHGTTYQGTLEFSHNWNSRRGSEFGKLNCATFTTIRIWHARYRVGNVFAVVLKGKVKGEAEIVAVKPFNIGELQEHEAYLDTGYSAGETYEIMRKMWKAKAIGGTFALILLKWRNAPTLTADEHFLIEEVYQRRAEIAQLVIDIEKANAYHWTVLQQKAIECIKLEERLEKLMLERSVK
jgi:hypothetical protein